MIFATMVLRASTMFPLGGVQLCIELAQKYCTSRLTQPQNQRTRDSLKSLMVLPLAVHSGSGTGPAFLYGTALIFKTTTLAGHFILS